MPKEAQWRRIFHTWAISLGMAIGVAPPAFSEEPAKAFLDRLVSKKYYDVALDFLDELEKGSSTPAELKSELQLQRARTIFRSTELIPLGAALEKRFDESNAAYAKFVAEQPTHPQVLDARLEMSRLLRSRAKSKLFAMKSATDAKKKEELRKVGGELLKNSTDQFVVLRDEIRKRLEPLEAKSDNKETPLTGEELTQRDSLRANYRVVRSEVAESYEDLAEASPSPSPERKQLLEKAVAEYREIATKYSRYDIGVYARVSEGRCQKKLGDFPGAIKILSEIFNQMKVEGGIVKDAANRNLGLEALLEAMECWLDDSQKAYPAAIAAATPWISAMESSEDREQNWNHLKYLTAVAHKKFADVAKAKDPKDDNAKKALTEARKLATQASKMDGPDQTPARKLLAEMGVEVSTVATSALVQVKTFEQAREAAQDAFNAAIELPERQKIIEERLNVEKDEAEIASLKKQLEEAKGGVNQGFKGALNAYRRALQLVLPSTPIDEVNAVRLQLANCYFVTEQYDEAAIVGEFVARRFPSDRNAKLCAGRALDSVKKLFLAAQKANQKEQQEFELRRMMPIAELITKNWPNDDEAGQALRLLIGLRMNAKDYEGVIESLAKIPEASPFRAEAESKAGLAFWGQYLNRQNELRTAANGGAIAVDAASDQMKAKAIELLQSSVKRFQGTTPNTASILATVSLADIFVKSGNPQQASVLLDDPASGPMTLLAKDAESPLFDAGLTEQVCRVSLATQIALLPTAPDPAAAISKASLAMDKLTEVLKKNEAGNEQRVVATYYSLARDMKQQLDLAKDPKVKANLASGAEKFLQGVRGNSKDPNLLRWVAETLGAFGESFDSGNGAPTGDAKRYYNTAADVYDEVLKLKPDAAIETQVKSQQAALLCKLGSYQAAYGNLLAILKDPKYRNTPKFQMEAARVLSEWGSTGGEKYYQEAISGKEMDPAKNENIVWGLAKLSNLTRKNPHYSQVFFDTRYTIAQCYFGQAKKASAAEIKTKMGAVKREISTVYQLYPQMGGPEWMAKFDALLKRAQKEMGEAESGLAGLKKPTGPSTPTPVKSGS